jgi:hypothetical protein
MLLFSFVCRGNIVRVSFLCFALKGQWIPFAMCCQHLLGTSTHELYLLDYTHTEHIFYLGDQESSLFESINLSNTCN